MAGNGKRTTLATAGVSFTGCNLCGRFLSQSDRIICIDDITTGMPAHLDEADTHPDFEFILKSTVDYFRHLKNASHADLFSVAFVKA